VQEAEVSPSNFNFAAKHGQSCHPAPSAAKLKFERLTTSPIDAATENGPFRWRDREFEYECEKLRSVLQISILRRNTANRAIRFRPPQN
jgi:hypothetical protein